MRITQKVEFLSISLFGEKFISQIEMSISLRLILFNEIRYFSSSRLPDLHAGCNIVEKITMIDNPIKLLLLKCNKIIWLEIELKKLK